MCVIFAQATLQFRGLTKCLSIINVFWKNISSFPMQKLILYVYFLEFDRKKSFGDAELKLEPNGLFRLLK